MTSLTARRLPNVPWVGFVVFWFGFGFVCCFLSDFQYSILKLIILNDLGAQRECPVWNIGKEANCCCNPQEGQSERAAAAGNRGVPGAPAEPA